MAITQNPLFVIFARQTAARKWYIPKTDNPGQSEAGIDGLTTGYTTVS